MDEQRSCGFLIIRGRPVSEFLLMRHADRWDLPKGHVDSDETDLECAYRELQEETGIALGDTELIKDFRFTTHYQVRGKRDGKTYDKTLIIFLGRLKREVSIEPTEHLDYEWFPWNPPHRIQAFTIDPLLAELERFFAGQGGAR
jgi:8-oxo-dGTP pyrophosphatase MutT (NUDIX family)